MLGLADREAVFDLLEAVMGGKPAAALAITDRAHERGADLGVLLQDLLDLVAHRDPAEGGAGAARQF